MKIGIVIQARMGSTRLPGKMLMPVVGNDTVLDWVLARVRQCQKASEVIVATTTLAQDDELAEQARARGARVYRGAEEDVLERFVGAAEEYALDALVRITGDCPLIEAPLIDGVIERGREGGGDYISTAGYPRGSGDAEFVTVEALGKADARAGNRTAYREHVTTYVLAHPEEFVIEMLKAPAKWQRPEVRLCVDEMADLEVVRRVCAYFAPRRDMSVGEILGYLDANPEVARLNRGVKQKLV